MFSVGLNRFITRNRNAGTEKLTGCNAEKLLEGPDGSSGSPDKNAMRAGEASGGLGWGAESVQGERGAGGGRWERGVGGECREGSR